MLEVAYLPTLPSLLSVPNQPFIHRDLSWLQFNDRVLAESRQSSNPILERAKFLAISASNLDEFFMIRLASLGRQIQSVGRSDPNAARRLMRIRTSVLETVAKFTGKQLESLDLLASELDSAGIHLVRQFVAGDFGSELGRRLFHEQILPKLGPPEEFSAGKVTQLENLQMAAILGEKGEYWLKIPKGLPSLLWSKDPESGAIFAYFLDDLLLAHLGESFGTQGAAGLVRVTRDGDFIHFDYPVKRGDNIRRRGEDIACGAVLLTKGQRLDARHVALLAGQGYGEIDVFGRVRVAVISTGNELRQMGQALDDSAIYDSNRETVMALAQAAGADVVDGGSLRDDPAIIADRLSELIGKADLIVTTGGASVGDEDHCSEAFRRCGGRLENLKIAMKPGKPAIVGRCGSSVYLGLPGNPIAAIVVWWLLGETMVKRAQGFQLAPQAFQVLPSRTSFPHKAGRTEFLPARIVASHAGNTVEIIGRGGSARLLPLIQAHGFVEIPAEQAEISIGDGLRFRAFFGDLTV